MNDPKRPRKLRHNDPLQDAQRARPDAIAWRGTGDPPSPLLETDDFVAEWNGYVLRVEQMDRGRWWWHVYLPDDENDDWLWRVLDPPPEMSTRADAMLIAESVARVHRAARAGSSFDRA